MANESKKENATKIAQSIVALQKKGYDLHNKVFTLKSDPIEGIELGIGGTYKNTLALAKEYGTNLGIKAERGVNGVEKGHMIGIMNDGQRIAILLVTQPIHKTELGQISSDMNLIPHHHTEKLVVAKQSVSTIAS